MEESTEQHAPAEACFAAVLGSAMSGGGSLSPKTRNDLDWDRILGELADRCTGDDARELALDLGILTDVAFARRRGAEVREAMGLLARGEEPPLRGIYSVNRQVAMARKELVLNGEELLHVGRTAAATGRLSAFGRATRGVAPLLAEHAGRMRDVGEVASEVLRCVDPHGDLLDDASPDLGKLRHRVRRLREDIQARLDRILKSPRYEGILQDQFVTLRDERYVVPVRSGERGDFPGIVHGHSRSGETLFIEPRELVESNNQLRIAQVDVAAEERRIFQRLTRLVARFADELELNQDILTYLDLTHASARLARDLDMKPVTLTAPDDSHAIDVREARHPVLAIRELAGELEVVANDIRVDGAAHVLVISGPNTGGKTVTLKTLGLFALMVRCGLPLPVAEGGRFPVFSKVFTDIGDEQTVERDLSTFSGHVANIASFFDEVDGQSLVLLDELFAGTDPEQGAALGRALLSQLAERGASVVVTTHLESLKTLGYEDARFVAASVAFDVESLAPTYRLRIGVPGSSYALRIAARLGLDAGVVEAAEGLLGGGASLDRERLIEQLEREHAAIAEERASLAEARAEMEANAAKLEEKRQRLIQRDQKMVDKEAGKLKSEVQRLRGELKRVSRVVRDHEGNAAEVDRSEARQDIEKARRLMRAADELAGRARRPSEAPDQHDPLPAELMVVGTRVYVPSFKKSGEIVDVVRDRAVVQLGPMRANFSLSDLRKAAAATEAPQVEQPQVRIDVDRQSTQRLDLRGERIDDAIERLDAYIDQALRARRDSLLVVHGHGTGALKRAVRQHLEASALVFDWRAGERGEGGDGVTVATLA